MKVKTSIPDTPPTDYNSWMQWVRTQHNSKLNTEQYEAMIANDIEYQNKRNH